MVTTHAVDRAAWEIAAAVLDPELPVLTLADLGVLRSVRAADGAADGAYDVVVEVTPTYVGCPAQEVIAADLVAAFAEHGLAAEVRTVWSPPWSTDDITPAGRAALAAAGVAPPAAPTPGERSGPVPVDLGAPRFDPPCPRCGARGSDAISRFGPTACTELRRCAACEEPFEHVRTRR